MLFLGKNKLQTEKVNLEIPDCCQRLLRDFKVEISSLTVTFSKFCSSNTERFDPPSLHFGVRIQSVRT